MVHQCHQPLSGGQTYAVAVVVSNTKIIWAESLLTGILAQKAELAALTKALELRKGKRHT